MLQNQSTTMSALSMPNVKLKWIDHLNSSWAGENCDSIATREGIHVLYERLVANKVCICQTSLFQLLMDVIFKKLSHF